MDDLHTRTFDMLVDPAWEHAIGAAIDIALLTRFCEHYADHAVAGRPPDRQHRHRTHARQATTSGRRRPVGR